MPTCSLTRSTASALAHTLMVVVAAASACDDPTVLVQRVQTVRSAAEGRVPPRRIQYLFEWKGGLSDRIFSFTFVNNLAHLYNATAHIPGGRLSASRHLIEKHSAVIAEDWGVYFDTAAHGGNPFHLADPNMTGCKTIAHAPTSWYRIFNHGEHCVNIVLNLHRTPGLPRALFDPRHAPTFSTTVSQVAERALQQSVGGRPFEFGYLHIRRCDRLTTNAWCTAPENVKALLAARHESTWLVFTYAEIGYLKALKHKLQALHDKQFVYEEDLRLDVAGDNYLLYSSMLVLQRRARSRIDLHQCRGRWSRVEVERTAVATEAEILEQRGVCRGQEAHGPYTA